LYPAPNVGFADRRKRCGGGGVLWLAARLPEDARLALANAEVEAAKAAEREKPPEPSGLFARASKREKEAALLRAELVRLWERSGMRKEGFLEAYNAGAVNGARRDSLGAVSISSFYRWLSDWRKAGRDIGSLYPKYSLAKKGPGATLSEAEKRLLTRFWLKGSRPSVRDAYGLLLRNLPDSTCSCHTARRFLESLPSAATDLYRNGRESFANSHLPFVDRVITAFKSLDCVVSDHHCLDMACLYNGKLARPWITTFQDYRSGKVLGWSIALSPSSISIICAYYMAAVTYGVPRSVLFDNGRDYRSRLLNGYDEKFWTAMIDGVYKEVEARVRGLFEIAGSEVHFTETYNGKSKGRQECYYRMLQEYIAKPSGGCIGNDTADRPESSELFFRNVQGKLKNNNLPSWEDAMIPFINDNFHSQGKGMDGKTASQVFEENLPPDIRRADRDALEFALTRGRVMGVRKSQVWLRGVGCYNERLLSYSGRKVLVRQSLLSDAEVLICDLDDRFLFTAAANKFKEVPGDPRKAIEKARRERRRLADMAEIGARDAEADAAYETWIDVAKNKYNQNQMAAADDYLSLPKAAGGEGFEGADVVPARKTNKTVKQVKGLFDVEGEDEF
jgi:hypothetical protein